MPRSTIFEIPVDTSHFTPIQLQTKTLLSLSWTGLTNWLKTHAFSAVRLIKNHQCGFVVMRCQATYVNHLSFFDAEALRSETTLKVRRKGTRLEVDVHHFGNDIHMATVQFLLCPVRIVEKTTMAAVPDRLGDAFMAKLQADEIDDSSPAREFPALCDEIKQNGRLLATHTRLLSINRYRGEVADQWTFFETSTYVEASREELALEQIARIPELGIALNQPLMEFDVEFYRPFYVFETCRVQTEAYCCQDRLVFLHTLLSKTADQVHGMVIERF